MRAGNRIRLVDKIIILSQQNHPAHMMICDQIVDLRFCAGIRPAVTLPGTIVPLVLQGSSKQALSAPAEAGIAFAHARQATA